MVYIIRPRWFISAPAITDAQSLLEFIANPQKAKALLDQLVAAQKKLSDLEFKAAALERDRNALDEARIKFDKDRATEDARQEQGRKQLAADRASYETDAQQHRAAVEKHQAAVTAFEAERAQHGHLLNELRRFKLLTAA